MDNNYQNNVPVQPVYTAPAQNLPMAFHNFYKWYLVIIGALALIPAFMSIGGDGAALSTSTIISSGLNIAAGICLMKMMKAGKIMQTIINVLGIIGSSFGTLLSLFFIFGGGMIAGLIGDTAGSVTGGVFIVLGAIMLIAFVASIVINACILKYYGKRKHLFN